MSQTLTRPQLEDTVNDHFRPRLISIGHNGLDLEIDKAGYISGDPRESFGDAATGRYIIVQVRKDGRTLAQTDGIVETDENNLEYYVGKVLDDTRTTLNPADGSITLPLTGDKYDFESFERFDKEGALKELNKSLGTSETDLDTLIGKNPTSITHVQGDKAFGQGALNTHYGHLVFDRSLRKIFKEDPGFDLGLISLYHSPEVQSRLDDKAAQRGVTNSYYSPLCDTSPAPVNANFRGLSKKLTLRVDINDYDSSPKEDNLLNTITCNDFIVINSIKENIYTDAVLEKIKEVSPHLYLAATGSMIKAVGKQRVSGLLEHSEAYFARLDEMESLTDIKVQNNNSLTLPRLLQAMETVKSGMKGGMDGDARVYVTFDDKGAFVLDENNQLFYHPVSKLYNPLGGPIVNTSGSGDSFVAIATYLETLRSTGKYSGTTSQILGYASVSGQIKARTETACNDRTATPRRIDHFIRKHEDDINQIRELSRRKDHDNRFVYSRALTPMKNPMRYEK